MCFNYKASLLSFVIGTVFSILLYKHGNKKFIAENETTGVFLFFISLIQFMDFLFWIDLKNKLGINKLMTIIGPLLNITQPTILYLIKYVYYKPDVFTFVDFNLPVALLNVCYFMYFLKVYIAFISTDRLVTGVKHGHLHWPWIKYASPYFYVPLLAINIFYLFDFKYACLVFSVTYSFLYLSFKYFHYNVGELWCFFGSFIPLILYLATFYIN